MTGHMAAGGGTSQGSLSSHGALGASHSGMHSTSGSLHSSGLTQHGVNGSLASTHNDSYASGLHQFAGMSALAVLCRTLLISVHSKLFRFCTTFTLNWPHVLASPSFGSGYSSSSHVAQSSAGSNWAAGKQTEGQSNSCDVIVCVTFCFTKYVH